VSRQRRRKLASKIIDRYPLRTKAEVTQQIVSSLKAKDFEVNTRRVKDTFIVVASDGRTTMNFVYEIASELDTFVVDYPTVFYVSMDEVNAEQSTTTVALATLRT